MFRLDRSSRTHPLKDTGGGVLIAIKSDLSIESKVVGANYRAEILSVEIKHGNNIFCLTTCYRVGELKEANYKEVEKHLRSIARIRKYKRHIFIGDLNLNKVQWPGAVTNCELQQKFLSLFNDLGMEQIVEEPSHENGKILDLLYVPTRSFLKNLKVLPKNQICSSDHFGITFDLTTRVKANVTKRKIFDFRRANWEGLNRDLNSVVWDSFLSSCDPNHGWVFFRNVLYLFMDKHIPTITIKNQARPPWFDAETLHMCKKKERLHRKFKCSGSAEDYSRFSQCRREFKAMIKQKMECNLNDDDNDPALISKRFWGHVKSTSKSTRIPESVFYNERHRSTPDGQASLFNDFFANQFSEPSLYNIDIDARIDPENDIDFSMQKIRSFLKQVMPSKAAGPDGIHGMVLKHCALGLAYPLSKLFQVSYNTGIIPQEWKDANVVPVHKKGTKIDVENYRPISLTCLIMKIFERVVRDHIMEKCQRQLFPNQHGFLPGKSCTTQMIDFNENLTFSINNKLQTDVIYFDFAKAFDSVHHDTLLDKLKNEYGIEGRLLKFLVNYLKNREQCVVIGGNKSEMKCVTSGVPQGSIIGPLLFVLFINDMISCISNDTKIALYADDTKIWRNIRSWDDHEALQKDIDSLYVWSLRNKMNFHPSKCKVIQINDKGINPYDQFNPHFPATPYFLGGCVMEFTNSEKDLGVLVTSKFSWVDQCNTRLRLACSRLGMLKRVCHFTKSKDQKRALYLAIVRSQYEHCCVVWRPTTETKINKFEAIQKRAVKWILYEEYDHYNDYEYLRRLQDLNLLPMKYFFMFNDLKMFHKIYYDICCVKLPSYFRSCNLEDRGRLRSNVRPPNYLDGRTSSVDLSAMRTMSVDDKSLKCEVAATSIAFKNSFFFRGHILWNYLPLSIRGEMCPTKFREALLPHIWDLAMKPD